MTFGVLQAFVPNEGDALRYTLDDLARYFERVLTAASATALSDIPLAHDPLMVLVGQETPALARDLISAYLQSAELMGQRTAELHTALAAGSPENGLAPEALTPLHQRSIYQSTRSAVSAVFPLLRKQIARLPEEVASDAQRVLDLESEALRRFQTVLERDISGMRIRCHGDYHLGQLLYTGKDFVIIDFEGEPGRPLSERRLKRSPLRDVAGMLRSFQYAAYTALHNETTLGLITPERLPVMEDWATFWQTWVSVSFLKSYFLVMGEHRVLPSTPDETQLLLDIFLLEKAVYELGYELNNRPGWVQIPLRGILRLLDGA
jgi:maltose alpha-D-glucosyltransferase/alpha-amylase